MEEGERGGGWESEMRISDEGGGEWGGGEDEE